MSTLVTQMCHFPSNNHTTPGYLAKPGDSSKHPGVVVIQEWWGLVLHIKEVANRFAQSGLIALAPDLYHGEAAEEPDEARKLAMALDRERAVEEILAAARYLQAMAEVEPKKIGVVGWCMGGALSLSAAASSMGEIGAAVAFYGRPLSADDTAKVKVPILGLYGEADQSIPVAAVREFEQELQNHQVPHQIHIYEGAQHAFFNDTRPHAFHPEATKDAWARVLGWFDRYLT